ncbi:MAG: ABC transporter ATP-binding protein [Pseudomonadota bacterium]
MLKALNLTKRYEDGVLALDNLNLHIKESEIYCLLGANGAGKTTTVNLFLDYIKPTSGEAFIKDMLVTKNSLETKKYVAYIPENVMLYDVLTARQNMDFFAKLGGKKDLNKTDYYNLMRHVGLQERAFEQRVGKLSKGMRQKLAIAIAILKDTPSIILDEPTAGLDPKAANEFIETLASLKNEGKAIFMVTHDIFRAKVIGDYVGIMKEGRLVMTLSKEELKHEDLEKIYLEYMQQ